MTTPAVAALILQIEAALRPLADSLQAVQAFCRSTLSDARLGWESAASIPELLRGCLGKRPVDDAFALGAIVHAPA